MELFKFSGLILLGGGIVGSVINLIFNSVRFEDIGR
jgi:hypothetical protein